MVVLNDFNKTVLDEQKITELYIKDDGTGGPNWKAKIVYVYWNSTQERFGWYQTREHAQKDLDQILEILQPKRLSV